MIQHQSIQNVLLPLVKYQGFQRWQGRSAFIRQRQDGFHALLVSLSEYEDIWWVELQLAIRNQLVEETIYQFTGGLKAFSQDSITASIPLHALAGRGQQRFEVPQGSWDDLTAQLRPVLDEYAWPFFETHKDLLTLESAYNSNLDAPCAIQTNEIYRAYRGLVLAKVTLQRDWNTLVQRYRDKLKRLHAPEHQIKNFELLQQWLTTTTFN